MKKTADASLPDGAEPEAAPKAWIKVENLPAAGEPTREVRIDDEELEHPRRKRGRPAKNPKPVLQEGHDGST